MLLAVLQAPGFPLFAKVRLANFDAYQFLAPRPRLSDPAVIVDIDDASLARHGQWPWPRTLLARLVDRIADADPAAIGVDILMLEPDRLSPARLPLLVPGLGDDVAERLARLPSNETVLAQALARTQTVLGAAGVHDDMPGAGTAGGPWAPVYAYGEDPLPFVKRFRTGLRSLPEIDRAADGRGLLNVEPEAGVVRRVPLIAAVDETLVPGFPIEILRIAVGEEALGLEVGGDGIRALRFGDVRVPTQRDGTLWVHFSEHDPNRFISARDVLAGSVPADRFHRRLVLIGVTALGLSDYQATPVGDRMAGVEIHAQVIENIFDGSLLARPAWTRWAEGGLLAVLGALLIVVVPPLKPRHSLLLFFAAVGTAWGVGFLLYWQGRILIDVVSPTIALGILFALMLSVTLAEVDRHRRALRRQLEEQRDAAARLAGELTAAQRIQMGILPKPADLPANGVRFDLHAFLTPARVVGGDLYDFFQTHPERLFFMIGDVSGKGLSSSLFMAVSKSLYKSTALRLARDPAKIMVEANAEISRENSELLFVTLFAGVLDLDTGRLEYGSAGHEEPYLLRREAPPTRLPAVAGPPLCVLDDYPYGAGIFQLQPRDVLYVMTDGVLEARNPAEEFYGRDRLEALLASLDPEASAETMADTLRDDVARFVAGADPADDLTILVLRWNGPAAAAGTT